MSTFASIIQNPILEFTQPGQADYNDLPFTTKVYNAITIYNQRRAMANLTDSAKRDMGLTDAAIANELAAPLWNVRLPYQR